MLAIDIWVKNWKKEKEKEPIGSTNFKDYEIKLHFKKNGNLPQYEVE